MFSSDNGGDLAMMDFDLSQSDAPVQCPLCSEMFIVVPDSQPLQTHLLKEHRLIISKINQIADLRQYLMYWGKLSNGDLVDYCTSILTNSENDVLHGKQQLYFMLSEHLPEDSKIRSMLKDIKLKSVTRDKERERADTSFSRKCVYCYEIVGGGLHNIFTHLTNKHSFKIGKPDNIIFGARLLDAIEDKFKNLQCLYCEKQFLHHEVLRIHMRKKGHRTLNPNNRFYDQFYLINYLQPGTPWQEVKGQRDDERIPGSGSSASPERGGLDEVWMDWREEDTQATTCLFCPYTTSKVPVGLLQHMKSQHQFDMNQIMSDFSFYDKVKAINYIRAKVLQLQCPFCSAASFSSSSSLQQHLSAAQHCKLPTPALWCTHQYLLPVLKEDGLLCHLDDSPDGDHTTLPESEVYGEDLSSTCLSPEVARELNEDHCLSDAPACCLFCRHTSLGDNAVHDVVTHMHSIHAFDLYQVTRGLEFYQQVKLVNYIRHTTALCRCYSCGLEHCDPRLLEEHRTVVGHTGAPDQSLYDHDRYLCPVLSQDPLLQGLQEDCWTDESDLEDDVTPPHRSFKRSKEQEQQLWGSVSPVAPLSLPQRTIDSSWRSNDKSHSNTCDANNVTPGACSGTNSDAAAFTDGRSGNNSSSMRGVPQWRQQGQLHHTDHHHHHHYQQQQQQQSGGGQYYKPLQSRDPQQPWRQPHKPQHSHSDKHRQLQPEVKQQRKSNMQQAATASGSLTRTNQSQNTNRQQQVQLARGEIYKHYQLNTNRRQLQDNAHVDAVVSDLQEMCLQALDMPPLTS